MSASFLEGIHRYGWLVAADTKPDVSTFYYFATALSTGVAAMLPFVPLARIGRRFFVLMSFIAVVFLALATAASGLEINYLHAACAGLLILYNVCLPAQTGVDRSSRREEAEGGPRPAWNAFSSATLFAAIAAGVAGVVHDALRYPVDLPFRMRQEPWLAASFLGSALLLGAALTAMVLGHWYLVARRLSFTPLATMTWILLAALLVRMASAAGSMWAQEERWRWLVQRAGWTGFFLDPGIFLLFRAVFGCIAPLALTWMAIRCVRIRSNQSATGILYVNLAFVLMGEITAKYFLISQGLVI